MTSLETEIARLKGNKDPATITELILDKCSAAKLQGNEFDDFPSLTTLSLNSVGLASLDKFPPLQHLKRLDLNDNKIAGGLEALQDAGLIHLAVLNLANNRIKSLDDIGPLGGLPSLRCLDLTRCEVTSAENYRATVFESIPSLKILDGLNEEGDEVDYDEEEEEDDDEEEDGGEDDEDDDIDDIEDGDEDGEEEDEYGEGEEDEDGDLDNPEEANPALDEDEDEEDEEDEGEEDEEDEGEGEGDEEDEEDEGDEDEDGATAKKQRRA